MMMMSSEPANANGGNVNGQVREDVFNEFYRNVMHTQQGEAAFTSNVYCVLHWPALRRVEVFQNIPGGDHAEVLVLKQLRAFVNGQSQINSAHDVVLYINYTPCRQCADQVIEFLQKNPNVTITLIAAAPYMVFRPSCRDHSREYNHFINFDEARANTQGLHNLLNYQPNCKLRGFVFEDWLDLAALLNQYRDLVGARIVVSGQDYIAMNTVNRSRENEDQHTQADLGQYQVDPSSDNARQLSRGQPIQ